MNKSFESSSPQMHIAMISPFSVGPSRGNITTVLRIAYHLQSAGCRITTVNLDTTEAEERQNLLEQARPQLLHAFHAYHAGPTARVASRLLQIPYMITITGSDLFDSNVCDASETKLAIIEADAVTCFDALVARRLSNIYPHITDRLSVIPQGVAPLPLNEPFPRTGGEFLILLPAALRPVKGVTDAIETLTPLAGEFPSLRLLVAGGELDRDYAARVHEIAEANPWVRVLGDVPHQRMGALFAAADLVLNSSIFEGGMANALLEAMAMGKPVLASDVLGNRSLVRHGETGWLYSSDNELRTLVKRMMANNGCGAGIAAAGRSHVQQYCSPQAEAQSYIAVYRQLIV